MNLKRRLQRLEMLAAKTRPQTVSAPVDFWAEVAAVAAYVEGTGPAPPEQPCPSGMDPARWEANGQWIHWMAAKARGEPLGEAERRWVEDMENIFAKVAAVHQREQENEAGTMDVLPI